jgi:hypothetical protein
MAIIAMEPRPVRVVFVQGAQSIVMIRTLAPWILATKLLISATMWSAALIRFAAALHASIRPILRVIVARMNVLLSASAPFVEHARRIIRQEGPLNHATMVMYAPSIPAMKVREFVVRLSLLQPGQQVCALVEIQPVTQVVAVIATFLIGEAQAARYPPAEILWEH